MDKRLTDLTSSSDNLDYVLKGSTLVAWHNPEMADIPAGVTSIGNYAFADCESLTVINIPDSVTSIGNSAFAHCKNLTAINIPDSVTSIGKTAFSGCESLTSIILPPGVTSIGFITFACCKSLASITLPIGVTSIGKLAFGDCESLTTINIPAGVTTIEFRAFGNCKSLTAVNIPDSVTSIGDNVFLGCENLGSITVEKQNPCFADIDGILFDKLKNRILHYPARKKGASYTIPSGIIAIGQLAFDCGSLTAINIPDSVTDIDNLAFYGCENLSAITVEEKNPRFTSIEGVLFDKIENRILYYPTSKKDASYTIPSGVTIIENHAFKGCKSLAVINIPAGVVNIGCNAFHGCECLTAIDIPDSVTSIGDKAFRNCKSLAVINMPDSVTSIGIRAFCDCKSLTAVNIPASVTSIGDDVFLGCENLGSITVEKQNPRFTDVDGVLFDKLENRILCYPADKKDISYTIPAGVTTIESSTFSGYPSLAAINIPASVTSIDNLAFLWCENLSSITVEEENPRFVSVDGVLLDKLENRILCYPADKKDISYTMPAGVTTIEYKMFSGCKNLAVITIPADVTVIKGNAFSGCENLSAITVEEKNPRFTSIDGVLFDKIENRILCYPAGKKATSYTIPAGITSIRHDAFDGCNILKTVYVSRAVSILNERGSLEYIRLGENQSVQFVYTD